jgi:hypothetical protein
VALVNAALVWLFDAIAAPIIYLAPLTSLIVVSALSGLAMLWVARRTSNQRAVAEAKRGIHAALLEIRLFNDDLGAVFRAVGQMLWQNLQYLRYSSVVVAWVALPLLLVAAQLQAFYGYEGLSVGEPTLLTLRLRAAQPRNVPRPEAFSLQSPDGIRVDTEPIVLPGAKEVSWRLVPTAPGDYTLITRVNDTTLQKQVHVSTGAVRRSQVRVAGLVDQLLYPSEPPLPDDGIVSEITLSYPEPGLGVFGWRVNWLVVFFAVSMVTAFAFAKRFGVTL